MASLYQRLDHGISVIDTGFGRPHFAASFLLVEGGRAAFIDTGPNLALPLLLAALEQHGLARDAVEWVIATHVHLDHAGAVGALMRELPAARLLIHPRGARHMIDPTQLSEGVRAVYGAEVAARDYGEVVPVPADRIVTTTDAMTLELAGRPLHFIHTPGHAKHHHCIWDERSSGWFTGDTFGIAYPELATPNGPYILPTTTPTQFDPEALHASIARLLERRPKVVYLTHYGAITEPDVLSVALLRQVDAMVDVARTLAGAQERHAKLKAALVELYASEQRRLHTTVPTDLQQRLLEGDYELNAQGLGVWLDGLS
ncbi:MAG TPA: MBL fold metallo-hydrolase [Polyangiales bacterium]|nr:MBL fold metallo-hydrolase [Polyangiales bacterium]